MKLGKLPFEVEATLETQTTVHTIGSGVPLKLAAGTKIVRARDPEDGGFLKISILDGTYSGTTAFADKDTDLLLAKIVQKLTG